VSRPLVVFLTVQVLAAAVLVAHGLALAGEVSERARFAPAGVGLGVVIGIGAAAMGLLEWTSGRGAARARQARRGRRDVRSVSRTAARDVHRL
jgi:hypothetical protein